MRKRSPDLIRKQKGYKFYDHNPRMLPELLVPKLQFIDEMDESRVSQKFDGKKDEQISESNKGLEEIMSFTKLNENSIMNQIREDQLLGDEEDDFDDYDYDEIERNSPQFGGDKELMMEDEQENANEIVYDSLMAEKEICGRDFDDEEDLDLEEIDRMLSTLLQKDSSENFNQENDKKRANPYFENKFEDNKKTKTHC